MVALWAPLFLFAYATSKKHTRKIYEKAAISVYYLLGTK